MGNKLRGFGFGLITLGVVFIFAVPTRNFLNLAGSIGEFAQRNYGAGILLFGFGAMLSFLGANLFGPATKRTPLRIQPGFPKSLAVNRRITYFNLFIGALILIRAGIALNSPLDIDENVHAREISQGRVANEINPIKTNSNVQNLQNHVVPQLLSYLSMKAFGVNRFAYRLPALLFTALTLLAIWYLGGSVLSPFTTMLLGLHLLANELVGWYFHSARGYAAMILFTAVPYLLTLQALRRPKKVGTREYWLLGVCFLLAAFTHLFALLFNGLLAVGWIAWLNLHPAGPSSKPLRRMLVIGLGMLPLFAFIGFHQMMFLQNLGDLQSGQMPEFSERFFQFFGFAFSWQRSLLAVAGSVLFVWAVRGEYPWRDDFHLLFLGATAFTLGVTVFALKVRTIEPRFMLAFLIPTVVGISELVRFFTPRFRARGGLALVVGLIAIAPFISAKALNGHLTHQLRDYDDFIKSARAMTSPVSRNCYTFSGKEDLALWARDFYFADRATQNCRRRYHLEIAPDHNFTRAPANLGLLYQQPSSEMELVLYEVP